jgi:hypothetical protein
MRRSRRTVERGFDPTMRGLHKLECRLRWRRSLSSSELVVGPVPLRIAACAKAGKWVRSCRRLRRSPAGHSIASPRRARKAWTGALKWKRVILAHGPKLRGRVRRVFVEKGRRIGGITGGNGVSRGRKDPKAHGTNAI